MFGKITRELSGIKTELQLLTAGCGLLLDALQTSSEGTADNERLSALEGRIEAVLGEVDGALIRADALKATARASEDRSRGHMKRAEKALALAQSTEDGEEEDPFEIAGRAYAAALPQADGDPGDGVLELREGVESNGASLEDIRSAKTRR